MTEEKYCADQACMLARANERHERDALDERVRDQRRADRAAFDKLRTDVEEWRRNYRQTFQTLNDENNALRQVAAALGEEVFALRRKWWWQLWLK